MHLNSLRTSRWLGLTVELYARIYFSFALHFSCTVVHALYIGLWDGRGRPQLREGWLDTLRMRRLREQIQAQRVFAETHKVRM